MKRHTKRSAMLLAFALAISGSTPGLAADDDKDVQKKKDLIKKVSAKLIAVAEAPAGMEWPPDVSFVASPNVNAYASAIKKGDKFQPIIRVFDGIMTRVVKGDEDRLAFILGHELAHILKRHIFGGKGETPVLELAFGRANEEEADVLGAELALKAGYSLDKGITMVAEMQKLGLEHSSFEGLDASHPSWSDRAKKIDKERSQLWKALSAFNNGVVFLATEQYSAAELCFDRVVKEFPESHEGWANLGYACLMQYCDKLDEKDLRDMDLGQIITGGFYFRAESIKVRSRDGKLWTKALSALEQSNKLRAGQILVQANLGLAYLVHPEGKKLVEANRYLTQAAELAKADPFVHPITNASVLVNLGIAKLANGNIPQGFAQLDEGQKLADSFGGSPLAKRTCQTFDASVLYTRATTLSKSTDQAERKKALEVFDTYLKTSSPISLWWPLAYDRYLQTCKEFKVVAKSRDEYKKVQPEPLRLVVSIKFKSGAEVALSEDIDDVQKRVGKGQEVATAAGAGLKRIRYPDEGIELLTRDEVLAISLTSAKSPTVALRGRTVASGQVGTIRVGMTVREAEELLGEDYQPTEISSAGLYYRFYRNQGLALRVVKNEVREVVIVQVPR